MADNQPPAASGAVLAGSQSAALLSLLQSFPADFRSQLHALLSSQGGAGAPTAAVNAQEPAAAVDVPRSASGEAYSTATAQQKAEARRRFVSVLNALARGSPLTSHVQASVYEEPTVDALSLLEEWLCDPIVASRLLYHRLDERVFSHVSRLRAAHNIPSAIQTALAPSPAAGVRLHDAGQAAFYPAAVAATVAQQQQLPMYGSHHPQAPGMLVPFQHLRPTQPVTQVPLPLPGPSKSPFPAEQRALLEDAFRKSRTITKDEAHALAQRLCGCVDSTTGAHLPAMTPLQVQNWFNNRRKALTKAAKEGTADRGGWQAGGGRRGGRRGRRAGMGARSHRRYDSYDDEPDEEEEGGGSGASPEPGDGGDAGVNGVASPRSGRPLSKDTSGGGDPSFNPRQEARGGATPLGTTAAPTGERRTQRSTAGRRLLEAGGAAAVEEANDALIEAVEANDREMEERKRFRYDAPVYGQHQPQRMVMVPAPGGVGERAMEQGDLDALEMCWASIPSPTGQQVAAMAQQLALSTHQVSMWYQSRQASAAAAQAQAAAVQAAAAARAASVGENGRPTTPPGAPAASAGGAALLDRQALLSHLFSPAVGVPSQMQPRMFGNDIV